MYSNLLCLMFTLFILLFFHEDVYCNKDLNKNSRKLLALHRKYRQDLVDCKVNGQPPAEYMSKLMVWAKTTDIGCGVANCQRYGLSVVCYYGPGGNWINEKPYKVKPHNLCPIVQSIPEDRFQTNRVHTRNGQKSINQREKKGVKYRPK
ncbi:unnamed protein product [Schistosoma rodhaini]|nr:unnamed protein product [Schistosoma rodhaini]